jgi:DNA-directed RNA polymerase specialized sigma24 family protein
MSGPSDDPKNRRIEFGRSFPFVLECVPNIMPGTSRAKFQTTSWSLVLAAAVDPTTDSRRALEALCQIYWSPVYAFIRRNGYDRDQSQDLTQGFFTILLEKNYLRSADRERGRFRSFLLTSVKHFLANEWDKTKALKRGGGQVMLSIDPAATEAWYAPAAVEHTTPEDLFERRWALSLLEHVMARLRAEFTNAGRAEEFNRLVVFLHREPDAERYEAVAAEMGVSAGALRTSAYRLRRKYRKLLRAEIAETVATPEETDEEIRFLLSTLNG